MLEWLKQILISNAEILRHIKRVEKIVSENQDKLDALSAQLQTATDGIRADIEALKAQPGAEALDFSALDARVEALAELDSENPAPVDPEV